MIVSKPTLCNSARQINCVRNKSAFMKRTYRREIPFSRLHCFLVFMRRMPLCEILFASRTNTDRLKKEGMQTQKKDKAKGERTSKRDSKHINLLYTCFISNSMGDRMCSLSSKYSCHHCVKVLLMEFFIKIRPLTHATPRTKKNEMAQLHKILHRNIQLDTTSAFF